MAIVNETLARQFLGGRNAVGARLGHVKVVLVQAPLRFLDELGPLAGIHETIRVGGRQASIEQVIEINRERDPIGVVGLPNDLGDSMGGVGGEYGF